MITPTRHTALLFSLGPVQDFIATARKGQDLWFGSWLLSDLSRVAANTARSQGADLILPAPDSLDRGDAVANKVVARVRSDQSEHIAREMEKAVRDRLAELGRAVFDGIERTSEGRHLHREAAEAQLVDLPEVYWVAVDESADGWTETRRRAEAALAARKTLRDFRPVTWGSPAPKSGLDGQRESVIDEAVFAKADRAGRAEQLRRIFGVGPAERLCGIGLLKRNGRKVLSESEARGARVISTAHVASWSLRRAWADAAHDELKAAFQTFISALPDRGDSLSAVPPDHVDPVAGRIDGQVLFESRLGDLYDGDDLLAARGSLARFLRTARHILEGAGRRWPVLSPYYAVLRADGDHMGAWLDSLSSHEAHRGASSALGAFSREAEQVVARHHGHCVFAGGDDVLALLPVSTALDCASDLNAAFAAAIARGPAGQRPTLSVGIQITHATSPFREALEGAADAERAAKHTYGRAAFAARSTKRSGSPLLVGGKWDALPAFRALQHIQEPDVAAIPHGFAYDLRGIVDRLNDEGAALNPIRALEVQRVLRQKDVAASDAAPLWARLGGRDNVDREALIRLCDELLVTRALAALEGEAA